MHEGGEFTVRVAWKGGEYAKRFTSSEVFGGTLSLSEAALEQQKCAGHYARQFIREVLISRGAL